jgi:hypothetical protein
MRPISASRTACCIGSATIPLAPPTALASLGRPTRLGSHRTHGGPSVPNRPWRPHLPDGPRGLAGVTTPPRPGHVLRWRYGPINASEGLALFHFVSRKPTHGHRHILDGGMFILIGYSSCGVSADGVSHPRLNPGTGCAGFKRMSPRVIWLNARVSDPKSPHPFSQSLTSPVCRAAAIGIARRSGRRPVKQWPLPS